MTLRKVKTEACTSDQIRGELLGNCRVMSDAQVGKKKAVDVQFYTEVMESVQTIDAGRRSMYDPDELEEEQRERDTKNRVRLTRAVPSFAQGICFYLFTRVPILLD